MSWMSGMSGTTDCYRPDFKAMTNVLFSFKYEWFRVKVIQVKNSIFFAVYGILGITIFLLEQVDETIYSF